MTPTTSVLDRPLTTAGAPATRQTPVSQDTTRAGHRVILAIVSVVLLAPLSALTAAVVIPLTATQGGWSAAAITTGAQLAVCALVAGGNLALWGDVLSPALHGGLADSRRGPGERGDGEQPKDDETL